MKLLILLFDYLRLQSDMLIDSLFEKLPLCRC